MDKELNILDDLIISIFHLKTKEIGSSKKANCLFNFSGIGGKGSAFETAMRAASSRTL